MFFIIIKLMYENMGITDALFLCKDNINYSD